MKPSERNTRSAIGVADVVHHVTIARTIDLDPASTIVRTIILFDHIITEIVEINTRVFVMNTGVVAYDVVFSRRIQ